MIIYIVYNMIYIYIKYLYNIYIYYLSACSKWATRTQATHRHKNLEGPTVFFGGPSASCCTAACFSHVPENWWKDVKGQTASPHLWYLSGKMLKRMAQTIVFLLKQGKQNNIRKLTNPQMSQNHTKSIGSLLHCRRRQGIRSGLWPESVHIS